MCLCNNTMTDRGFIPCTEAGVVVDPATEPWITEHYLCVGCWRIIDGDLGAVRGYATPLW